MGTRSRSLETARTARGKFRGYFLKTPGSWTYGFEGINGYKSMSDTTGPWPYVDHPLTAFTYYADPLRISGRIYSNDKEQTGGREYVDYNPPNRSGYSYCPTITAVNWDYIKTKALANMNPSKPVVDLPVALFELREFPRMLRQLGRVLNGRTQATDVAGGYLAYSFGWAPLIGDAIKLFNLQEEIAKRAAYLQRLSRKGGDRVARSLYEDTIRTESRQYVSSSGLPSPRQNAIEADIKLTERQKAWYSARAELLIKFPNDDALQKAAFRSALGLNLSAASLWEALPWSWLIDYFVNIGDVLEAQRGYIPYRVKSLCLMCKSTVREQFDIVKTLPGISARGGHMLTVAKQRSVVANPTPTITFRPFLTGHHYAIMGSLATVKALRLSGYR